MKTVVALQFNLGLPVGEPVTEAARELYTWMAGVVLGGSCELSAETPATAFALSNRTINNANESVVVYHAFWKLFSALSTLPDLFVIHMRGPAGLFRGHLSFQLGQGVAAALSSKQMADRLGGRVRFLLLLPELPSSEDGSYRAIAEPIANGTVLVVSPRGGATGTAFAPEFESEEFLLKLAAVRGDPYELLQKKMIQRLGHFHRATSAGQRTCVRTFYDGRFCQREIFALVEKMIHEASSGVPKRAWVFYHCPQSPWLMMAVLALKNVLNINLCNLADATGAKIARLRISAGRPTFLIVDLVATGNTLHSLMDLVARNKHAVSNLRIISVLASNPTDGDKRTRDFNHRGKIHSINYFMVADQRPRQEDCPLCKLEIPFTDPSTETFGMLTAFDHWELALEAGVKPEDNAPSHRATRSLPYVLNYPKMIAAHGAWFAHKVKEILSLQPGGFPADAIVVCPAHERGSQVFTDYLKMLLEVTVIRIPRDVVSAFSEINEHTQDLRKTIQAESPAWYRDLVAAEQTDIIVMDEFNASGQTFEGLGNLLVQMDKHVRCFFSFNDLNIEWSDTREIPVYSLYRWQSYRAEAKAIAI